MTFDNRAANIDDVQIDTREQQPPKMYGQAIYDNIAADLSPEELQSRQLPPSPPSMPPPTDGYDNPGIQDDFDQAPPRGTLYKGNYNPGSDTAV